MVGGGGDVQQRWQHLVLSEFIVNFAQRFFRKGNFEFGFYQQDNGFAIGIWLVGAHGKTVGWTDPLVNSNAKMEFTTSNKLLLITEKGERKLIANTSNSSASMLDSGNFVIGNKDSDIIWESFKPPTDTILQGQVQPTEGQLFSSVSDTNHSTGRFHLKMQSDGNLVLYPSNTEDCPQRPLHSLSSSSVVRLLTYSMNVSNELMPNAYWASNTAYKNGAVFHLFLDSTGLLSIVNTTSFKLIRSLNVQTSLANANQGGNIVYRVTVDANGNFQLYSHVIHNKVNNVNAFEDHDQVSVAWSALKYPREVKGICGLNSYCTLYDRQPNCVCIPGTEYADPDRRSLDCLRNFSEIECGSDGKENVRIYNITRIESIKWGDISYAYIKMTDLEECSRSCLEDCNCGAAMFDESSFCTKQKLPLRHVRRDFDNPTMASRWAKEEAPN
ncbi:hypothetical protein TIFTF001_031736 [Ficus carica]|uniref:Uncharacterized protein n=1 Tax=Ficus carica TaxID=3494 RepID=A0AA88DVH2_FICCA|nr:hypothetical protein TIFTF001_031736 [Ficus carica]